MSRRRSHEEHLNHEAWAIPYGDLITLLLAFFVVMYAISSINEGKYRVLSDSLTAAFRGEPTSPVPIHVGEKQVGQGADISMSLVRQQMLEGQPRDLLAALPVRAKDTAPGRAEGSNPPFTGKPGGTDGSNPSANGKPGGLEGVDGTGHGRELEQVANSIEAAMAPLIESGQIAVRRTPVTVEVEIRTDILFPSGESRLTPVAVPVIERIGNVLTRFPNEIVVEGHTDNRPISTPTFPSNWELSAGRAASVVHLLTQIGIDPNRLTVIGRGELRPVKSNDTAAGRNANRRVVIVIRGTPSAEEPAAARSAAATVAAAR